MPERDRPYLDPYHKALQEHGPGFKATLWGNKESQKLRFDVIAAMAQLEHCLLLDAGCGQGDFAAHLLARGIAFDRCHGIDALPAMIASARARSLARCAFDVADMVVDDSVFAVIPADYVCFSGSLNTLDEPKARRIVRAAFEAAHQGVVFNFLSDRPHARWRESDMRPARRFRTLDWLDWAMTLSSRVSFSQEYLDGHDATILIRHDG
jgi:SAM-dependent methyltransferase